MPALDWLVVDVRRHEKASPRRGSRGRLQGTGDFHEHAFACGAQLGVVRVEQQVACQIHDQLTVTRLDAQLVGLLQRGEALLEVLEKRHSGLGGGLSTPQLI